MVFKYFFQHLLLRIKNFQFAFQKNDFRVCYRKHHSIKIPYASFLTKFIELSHYIKYTHI